MKVIGHRGWPVRYPDNSLEGILAARDVASMVEIDIRRAGNGELVLCHDPVTTADGLVRLPDLLAAIDEFPLNLEVKNFPGESGFEPNHETGLATAALARPIDLLTCFFWPTVDVVRRRFPDLHTGLLIDRGWDLRLATQHALALGHQALVAHWSVVLEQVEFARAAADQGLQVMVWTMNDPEQVVELANAGVSGIITDDPGAMTAALKDDK